MKLCKETIMGNLKNVLWLGSIALFFILSSCVAQNTSSPHVVGSGSSLSYVSKQMAAQIQKKVNLTDKTVQISANNFWEKGTKLNLPFSSVLSEALSSDMSKLGANISLQEIGDQPLKLVGSYIVAGEDVMITVKLRQMGEETSVDLAVVEERISRANMDPGWLTPEFERIARSLVRLLEFDYTGMLALKVQTLSFVPAAPSQPELVLGDHMAGYMKDAMAAAAVFRDAGDGAVNVDAQLIGEYVQKGGVMEFHASVKDKKTGQHVAGAKISLGTEHIPYALMQPKIQSLDAIVDRIADQMLKKAGSKLGSGKTVYVGQNSFYDSGMNAICQLGRRIGERFRENLSGHPELTVTSDPSAGAALVLTGQYYKEGNSLVVTASLDERQASGSACGFKNITSAKGRLGLRFVETPLMQKTFKGYIDHLMVRLEREAMVKLPCSKRTDLMIHKFKLDNKKYYSKLSDHLNTHVMDYFASSLAFSPVVDVEKRLTRSLAKRTAVPGERAIVVAKNSEAAVAKLAEAEYFVIGSFSAKGSGNIEVKTQLMSVKGKVLATEQALIKNAGIDPDWLKVPEQVKTDIPPSRELSVELFTKRGSNNLQYRTGEEIIFLAKANKNVFLRIFSINANGEIYRIYPNDFDHGRDIFWANEITAIPNDQYPSDFKFLVQGQTGNEMVLAFASDQPLKDLPGSQEMVYGMKKVRFTAQEIVQWYSEYASKRGISLSWDSLPILTGK